MAASAYFDTIQKMYIAYFGRPADPIGLEFWAKKVDAAAGSLDAVISGFAASTESQALFGNKTSAEKVNAIYTYLFNRPAEPAGLNYWVQKLDNGEVSQAGAMYTILSNAGAGDVDAIANKLAVANEFTKALDTTAEILGYSGANAAEVARTYLQTVNSTEASKTAALAAVNTTVANVTAAGQGASGQTFTLTKGVDVVKGTSGNDTIIADNTGAAADKQLSAADQIDGGAGVDTLKVYLAASDTATGQPTLTNVENVWINGGAVTAYTAAAGTTGLTVEAPVADTAATYTLAGQDLTLKSFATTAAGATTTVAKAATGTQTAQKITLDGVAGTTAGTNHNTIDVTGAGIATLNLVATGANSAVSLANTTGAAIKTINISGDKNLSIVESAAMATAVTKVDASTATGNIAVDTSAGAKAAAFAFTGGTGNDTLTLRAGDLTVLTAGSQLDGGAGNDKLVINDTALTAGIYTAINAAKSFEVLGLGTTGATVDAAQLSSIKSFETGVASTTINNLGAGSAVAVTAATTAVNLGAAVGNTAVDITVGSATAAGFTTTALTTTGLTNITLTANGTSKQTITTLNNSDNTLLTIKGAADLEITNALAGGTTGNKVDASALTGKLTVTGSAQADILIGGSNDDVLTGGAGADTLTGGAGKDKFVINALATAAGADTITDFTTKVDTISFNGDAATALNYKEALSAVADFDAALAAANVQFAAAAVKYSVQQVGNDSYVFYTATAADGAADMVVKLTGVALTGIEFTDIVA